MNQSISNSDTSEPEIQNLQSEYLVEVPYEYVADPFNHTDLQQQFGNFHGSINDLKSAIQLKDYSIIKTMEPLVLYGIIHRRYIQTEEGLKAVKKLVQSQVFGKCPKDGCNCQVVPVGLDNEPGVSPFAVYCVKCNDIYHFHGQSPVDGAFFGVDIAQLLFLRFPDLEIEFKNVKSQENEYCGKYLFGFAMDYDKLSEAKIEKEIQHKQRKELRQKTQTQEQ